ncbi:MAG: SDR family oxidoreductase [Chloroflexi bacterium]|nr:SDR family oxidoreductase [Chloroflexota bacterium]
MASNLPTVLITGCSSGIGRAAAIYCAARGWRVFATARRIETLRDLQSEQIYILPLDVADEKSRIDAVEQVVRRAGRIDALVNNAAYSQAGPLAEVTLAEMRAQFETNLFGALHLAQLVIPQMRKQNAGRIVNVGSVVGRLAFPFGGLYCGSKYALEAISDALRLELKPWGIHVSVVEPGGVLTKFAENAERNLARFRLNPNSAYRAYLKTGGGIREAIGVGSLGSAPETVARVIHRAISARFPRPRYQATLDAWIVWPLLLFIPDWAKDFALARIFGLHRRR